MVDNTGHAVSFVIPALNEELLIGRCINSIKREIERSGVIAEVVVVDNGSTDATVPVALVKGARVVHEARRGIQSAKAQGLKVSRYPIVATIDADSMLREGWITRVLKAFDDPRVVAVSGPYRYYDLRIARHLIRLVFALYSVIARFTPMMMGGNSAFRREALENIGGFDPNFTFWGEDTRNAIALSKVGRVKFDPKLRIDTSGRRLIEQGYVSTFVAYLVNYLAVRFTGRAAMRAHRDCR